MKKLIAIGFAGLLFSGSASAQGIFLNALVGPNGVVESAVVSLSTADAEPLVNSLAGANSGLLQGTAGDGLNDVLGGLLVDQDPARIQLGLETILMVGVMGPNGVFEQLFGTLVPSGGGSGGLPGLDGVPLVAELVATIEGALQLDGALPGLPGGSAALSPAQLEQVSSLLSQ